MNPVVRSLFHELLGLSPDAREKVFADRHIEPEIRAEVESLLGFDSTSNHSLTEGVTDLADDMLQSSNPAEVISWGPYRRIRLLGAGGMGTVYLAERTDGEVQQKVAVKLLRADTDRPAWRSRFLKERQLLADLSHPAIARLLDAGHTSDGRPYLIMEYVDGVPIDVYAAGKDLRDQLLLFLQVCDGVSHAHGQLIIHRDLKPSNILVNSAGQPKLLDFGIAKLLDETADRTQTIERLLTPNYASPEQLRGTRETITSDVYSLGAVLYKILTGRSPHESESGTTAAMDVVMGATAILPPSRLNPGIPSDIDYILRKALRREPEGRYASVEAFGNDIRAFLEWRPVQARSGDTWYRTRKFLRRYWVPVAAVVLLIAGLSLGLYEVNRERAIAQRRFEQVRQLANKVLALDQVIRALPGSTKARHEIVAMAKEYLEALSTEPQAERDLALELGTAYSSLAMVQGVPATANLGQYAEAEQSLIKADGFIDTVLTHSPQNRKALLTSAEISHNRMILADTENRRDAAVMHARKAAAQTDSLLGFGQTAPPELSSASTIFCNIALMHKNQHRYADAIHSARRCIDVSRSLTRAAVSTANAFSIIADSLRFSGDPEGALQAIQEARKNAERIDSQTVGSLTALFNVLWREGVILGEDGQINLERPDEAIVLLQKAFDLADDWSQKDINTADSRILVAQAARELGDILRHRDAEHALAVYDRAVTRLREIKNNAKARREEARLMASSSYPLRRLNRSSDAKQRIDAAFKLLRETKSYPADLINPGDQTETVLLEWGTHLADTGQPQRAAETYQALLDKIMASHPDPENDLPSATALSRIYEALAGLHLRSGEPAKAQAMSTLRLGLWQKWDSKLPQNVFVRRQLESATPR